MATKITDTEMTSDQTRHTAAVKPGAVVEGGPTAWSVTWLPGRLLTRDQAITAMTIAEVAASHEFLPVGDEPGDVDPVWVHIDGWAAELGISGPHAVAEASLPPEDHASPAGVAEPASCAGCGHTRAEHLTRSPSRPVPYFCAACGCRQYLAPAPGVNESEAAVARAVIDLYGAGAPAYLRELAAQAEAEGNGTRDSWLRFAEEAERLLGQNASER